MKSAFDSKCKESVQDWLVNWLAAEFALPVEVIDPNKAFLAYGMNSIQAMMVVGDLEDALRRRLSPTLVWEYPTIAGLAQHVVELEENFPTQAPEPAARDQTMPMSFASADADALLAR